MYRRRRIVAVILALVLLGGLTAGGFAAASMITSALAARSDQPKSAAASPMTVPTESASGTDAPTTDAGNSSTGCEESTVTVTAATDQQVYPAETNPVLTLQVKNGGKTDCVLNLGTSQMEFLITSGNDRIFSSKDCQVKPEDKYETLAPGQSELANFQWARNRTAPGCDPVQIKPKPGVYVLVAKLGERVSKAAVFELQ